jgi:hypothetical protein
VILEAATCAENKGQPPPELQMAWDCQAWGALPEAGGMRDQPAGLMLRMRTCLSVFQAWRDYAVDGHKAGEMAAWAQEHAEEWRIVGEVKRIRNL